MRSYILLGLFFIALPFVLARPHVGILIWTWFGLMNPHRLTYGISYSFDFVYIIAIVTLLAVAFTKENKKPVFTGLTVSWLVFLMWVSMTTLFALNSEAAVTEWIRLLKTQVLILVTLMIMASEERIKLLVWVVTLSIAFFGVKGGVFSIITGGSFRVWGPAGSYIEGNNELALALIIILPLLRFLQNEQTNKKIRMSLLASQPLVIIAIITSYSRGAFLAGIVMLLFLWFKSKKKILGAFALIILGVGALIFMPQEWFDRMDTIQTYEEDRSALGRINAWYFAFNVAKDRPLTGGGFSVFDPEQFLIYAPEPTDFHAAHSIYFQVLGEHGFIGLLLFIMIGVMFFLTASDIVRISKPYESLAWASNLADMLKVSYIGFAVGGAFLTLAYYDLPYHLLAIMVLTSIVVKKKISKLVETEGKDSYSN